MNRSDKKRLRKTLFIDAKNQGEFIKQCFFRWYLCTSLIIAVVVIFTALNNPAQSALLLVYEVWNQYSAVVLASFLLLPIFMYDALVASNRIAGPVHRLGNELQNLADGKEVKPIRFRDGDYFERLAEQFNTLAAHVQNERKLRMLDGHSKLEERETVSV
jgi:methyl-accepting chemotaxis protein